MRDGKIAAVGASLQAPADAAVVDGTGKWVTPGIIDAHSHLGVYAAPGVDANSDGNEATDPDTAQVWAEHSVWPQDPQFPLTLATGGVTTMQILPGSANLFGGRSVTVKNVPAPRRLWDEVPRRSLRPQDGLRREPQAGLRQQGARPLDPHGQRGRLPRGLDQGEEVPRRLGRVPPQAGRRQGPLAARPRPPAGDPGRRAGRRHPGPEPLLPRRRDAHHDRHRQGVRLQGHRLPPRRRGLQDRRRAGGQRHLRRRLGRLVGLQDGGLRRHPRERRADPEGRRLRRRSTPIPPSGSSG